MEFSKFLITNFRSWQGENELDLSNINLLLGGNSSGKSSIIHALSLLKQSEVTHRLVPTSSEIDLGRIADQININARKHENELGFGLRFQLSLNDVSNLQRSNRSRRNFGDFGGSKNVLGKSDAEVFRLGLGDLKYKENYDSLGRISRISLSNETCTIIKIALKVHPKTTVVSVDVTNNQHFWRHFIDEKAAFENVDTSLFDRVASDVNSYKSEMQQVSQKINEFRKDTDSEKKLMLEPEVKDLMRHRAFLVRKVRELESYQQILGLSEIEKNFDEICTNLSKNLSFEVTFRNTDIEEERNVLSLLRDELNSPYYYFFNERRGGSKQEFLFNEIRLQLALLSMRSTKIDLNPFILLMFARSKFSGIVRSVERIGPHRQRPERISIVNPNEKITDVGVYGEKLMTVLQNIDRKQFKALNHWLENLEIPYQIKPKFNKQYNIFELILIDRDKNQVSLSDVGYGIGQVLPIVIMSLLKENTLITIEQPELHLHPRLQANLADLFIKSAKENGNKFILETHSEHIVLRLKRRQREAFENGLQKTDEINELPAELRRNTARKWGNGHFIQDVWRNIRESVVLSVIEMEEEPRFSVLTKITLTRRGDFSNLWPGDFFPERYVEIGLEN